MEDTTLTISIPEEWVRIARSKGISPERLKDMVGQVIFSEMQEWNIVSILDDFRESYSTNEEDND